MGEFNQRKGTGQGKRGLPHLLGGQKGFVRQVTSLLLTKKFQMVWFKIKLLGEVETAVRLGTKSWFAEVAFSIADSILDMLIFLGLANILTVNLSCCNKNLLNVEVLFITVIL